ncbi:related to transporter (major facilitator superfamily) [Armillaria ostoyae]|uniref:Related to transporter (Major facilitator superfamily) n=1 Tax=Armillaria ostoyae TaxID=47428 RepID=A0A284RM34_ARMOS|nr:related to transporter (major facilitator superfamily) [Armillaria ostoyae]
MAPGSNPEWTIVDFIHHGPWWTNRGILLLNLCLFLPLLTSSVNGLDSSLINGLQILPDWQDFFGHPEGVTLGVIQSAQNMGAFICLPLTPFAADILGRRAALFIGSVILLSGVAIQFSASSVKVFIVARVILGCGLAFCTNSAPLLLLELAYPTQRGKITSFYNSSWYFGSIISAWVCYGSFIHAEGSMWSWHVPTLIQAVAPLLQVCLIWFTPESPRYLVSKGYEGKAARILAKYHANDGDERDPLVVFELAQIRHALRIEEDINKSTSYLSLVSTPGNRKRMMLVLAIAIFSQWSGNGLVSYYINLVLEGVGITKPETKAAINGALQVFNLIVALSAASLIDWVGRRMLFIISNSGMLVAFGCWTITEALFNEFKKASAAKATIPLIFLFYFFYGIAYTPMLVAYTLEILPYKIRAKGFAVMNIAIMLTSAFNQCVNPWAIDAIGWWYYIVYCGWLIIELVFVVAFIVETKGRTLEETAALFDGDEQPQDLANMGGEAATLTMNRGLALQLQERPLSHSDDGDHKHNSFESSQPMLRVTIERSVCTDSEVGRTI